MMTPERWQRIKELYDAAAAHAVKDRSTFLRTACGDDDALYGEVESLLAHTPDPASVLAEPGRGSGKLPSGRALVGQRLGSYEIRSLLGVGGMGEVYRARDVKLGRDVAIKVLPEIFTRDHARLARLAREAQVLATLNHPHIGAIYGVEESDDVYALVLELVEGPTLAERLARGSVPLSEALAIARQIADGLEAAHDRNVIHRDLKPANIKVTPDGRVKILDFGIAKVLREVSLGDEDSQAASVTRQDTIIGTPPYMSPEQLRGQPVDRRTDIWSYGCVFYELLVGRRAFGGPVGTDTLAAILRDEPDWAALDRVPTTIHLLIRRCIRKDLRLRLRDIADARLEIEQFLSDPLSAPTATTNGRSLSSPRRVLLGTIVAGLALTAMVVGWLTSRPRPPQADVARVAIRLNPGQHLVTSTSAPFALSRDGTRLAYVAARAGAPAEIFLRRLDRFDATPIVGTKGATSPFFSPDGEWVGFYAADALQRVSLRGGAPLKITDAPPVASATWTPAHGIVFATTVPGDGLWRTADGGGVPEQLTTVDRAQGEIRHTQPRLLPDGTTVLFTSLRTDGAYAALLSLKTRKWRLLSQLRMTGGGVQFVAGRLVYGQAGSLVTTEFDPEKGDIRGLPLPLLERAETAEDGTAWFEVVPGALVYVPGRASVPQRTLVLVDRDGRATPLMQVRGGYAHPRFSPDGRWLAATVESESGSDIWVFDVERGTRRRFTTVGDCKAPTWTPDTRWITFQTSRTAGWNLFRQRSDGSGPPEPLLMKASAPHAAVVMQIAARLLPGSPPVLTGANPQYPASWAVGGALAFTERRPSGERDIWVLEPGADPTPFLMTPSDEWAPAFSPDGRFLAYTSDESGQNEVYVQPYPGPGQKWLISTDGGVDPVWAPDGRQLFYRVGTHIMVVPIQLAPPFTAGKPKLLFDGVFEMSELDRNYDVTPDGRHFLMIRAENAEPAAEFRLVFNWSDQLRER